MPKGGDLHNHLTGSIYAESYLRWAAEDNLCLATADVHDRRRRVRRRRRPAAGERPCSRIRRSTTRRSTRWSMRHWPADRNGHDHFFATFAKFDRRDQPPGRHARRSHGACGRRARQLPRADADARRRRRGTRSAASRSGIRTSRRCGRGCSRRASASVLTQAQPRLDVAEARRQRAAHVRHDRGRCRDAASRSRYIVAGPAGGAARAGVRADAGGLRDRDAGAARRRRQPRPAGRRSGGRARLLAADVDDRFPARLYPAVRIALHAASSSQGLVPPEVAALPHPRVGPRWGTRCGIGHGGGRDARGRSDRAAPRDGAKRVLVEIALTSNDLILGVNGQAPSAGDVPAVRRAGRAGHRRSRRVAVEPHARVGRRPSQEHGLDYRTLKRMVRNSVEYAFADAATQDAPEAGPRSSVPAEFERRQAAG